MPGQRRARVDHGVATGTFSLDGQTFDVDNNIWVVGDDTECVVIDAPHRRTHHAPPGRPPTVESGARYG